MSMRPVEGARVREEEAGNDFAECLCLKSFIRVQSPQVAKYCEDDDEEHGPQQPTRMVSHSEEVSCMQYIHMLVNKNRQKTRDVPLIAVMISLRSLCSTHPDASSCNNIWKQESE